MDTLIEVPHYPTEDTKLRADSTRLAGGGPTATGIVAAAKLGSNTAYIGVLSDDAGGTFLLKDFQKYGVDTAHVNVIPGYRSFTSTIWLSAESSSRTCVFDRGNLPALQLSETQKQAIKDAELLMIDGNEMAAAEEAVKYANECGVKVLYDAGGLYDGVEKLLPHTDILIPSEEFALKHTGCDNVEDAAKELFEKYAPEVVVITQGKEGGILYDGKEVIHYPAFPVKAVDSNGAGDVFHGAFAAGMVKGYDYFTCCTFASATSAIKCTGIGARESVPDYETVKQFIKDHRQEECWNEL